MAAKHFLNDATALVNAALASIPSTNPHCAVDLENKIVYRHAKNLDQVSVVSGGGAGHEPSFVNFVGPGLLSAAISGTIFASPSAEQIRRCLFNRVNASKGVLIVVMNYTGDVLNFGLAAEKAKAAGLNVDMIVVGDDCGVPRSMSGKVGRRGIAGTCLVQKIAGAIAADGASLDDVRRVTQLTADNLVSIGSSLAHVHVPGREFSKGEDELGANEVEIGMGIHNESGAERAKADLPALVKTMLEYMLDGSDKERSFLNIAKSDETVLLVNNLGGVSPLEMSGIAQEVMKQLSSTYGVKPVRILVGTFMTSLNGMGFSISLLKLQDSNYRKSMLELLDAGTEAPGWSNNIAAKAWGIKAMGDESTTAGAAMKAASNLQLDSSSATKALQAGLNRVIAAESDITHYDTIVGDGDCGIGLRRGAEAIKEQIQAGKLETTDAIAFLDAIISTVETSMDGTSGALYAIFLNALSAGLQKSAGNGQVGAAQWAKAAETALKSLGKYTPAVVGDRTLVDALQPFIEELNSSKDVKAAAEAAKAGADKTKDMKASLGRTVYVGGDISRVPDPGAYGLAEFLSGLAAAC